MVANYEVQLQSHARTMNIEDGFRGMKYSNVPLDQGYCRRLVNFDITNGGVGLQARPGFVRDEEPVSTWLEDEGEESFVHHVGRISVQDYNDSMTTTLCRYAVVGQSHTASATEAAHGLPDRTFMASKMKVMIQYKGNIIVGTYGGSNSLSGSYMPLIPTVDSIHGQTITSGSREGVFATYDGNTYIPVFSAYTENNVTKYKKDFRYIKCMFNAAHTSFTWELVSVVPREITAVQAVNYGYNMLKDAPYTFEITQTTGSTLLLDGIIPYSNNGQILTTCRAGDMINFKLAYRYPAAHASYHYVTMWDITDNNSENAETMTLQPLRTGQNAFQQDVVAGNDIVLTTNQTSYTSFTLTCYVYNRADVLNVTYENGAMDAVNCQPLATMTVSFSYLTDDTATTSNLTSQNYDLGTAKGMCQWQSRIALWGVNGAQTTLFISDMNDPSYFPYPNNVEVFDSAVVRAMPFKDTLLVFTEDTLYQISLPDDGIGFKTTAIQQGLRTEPGEASSILAIQNMLFFKNGNYYYMLVPGKYASNQYGELQLAPVSDNIAEVFDYFNKFLAEMYPSATTSVHDWWCYIEQNTFRIVYKIKCVRDTDTKYFDLMFLYNTKSRGWTMYQYEAGPNRMVQWIQSATIGSTFLAPYGSPEHLELWLVNSNPNTNADLLPGMDSEATATCLLDTGYRNIDPMHTKKFRQAQFFITTEGAHFALTPTIYVDNMYVYNRDTSYIDEDGLYVEMYQNDIAKDHTDMSIIPDDLEYFVADRVCIPYTGRGRVSRLVFAIDFESAEHRPEIRNLTWVYRTKSGRGGRDGNDIE